MITDLLAEVRRRSTPVPDTSFWRPGTQVPRPMAIAALRPTGTKPVLYQGLAIVAGLVFLAAVALPAIRRFVDIVRGDGAMTDAVRPTRELLDYTVVKTLVFVVLALAVLGFLLSATDERTVGLARPVRGPHHRVALGFYLRTVCVAMLVGNAVFVVAVTSWLELGRYVGGGTLPPLPVLDILRALAAGWCEEIVATMLVWWILDRIPASRGRSLAHTGYGTAIIIAVHVSYHLSMGIKALLLVIPVYFTVVCWRYARSLPALIVGHVVFDLVVSLLMPEPTTVRGAVVTMLVFAAGFLAVGTALDHRWLTAVHAPREGAPPPPVVHPVPENLRGPLWPRTDVQPSADPSRSGFWREYALCLPVLAVAFQFGPAIGVSAQNVGRWFTGEPMLSTPDHSAAQLVLELLWAVMVVAILVVVAGPRAAGLQRRGPGEFALAAGYALRGVYQAHVVTTTAATVLVLALASGGGSPSSADPGGQSPWWFMVLACVNAGVVEEILLTVLPYFLLEQIRTRSGKPVAHTWIGTCLIVGGWLFLHAYRGPFLLWVMAPVFYFKLLLWRHTKVLPVLVGFHIGWDLVEYFGPKAVPNILVLVLLKFVLVAAGVLWESHGARRADDAASLLAPPAGTRV